MAVGCSIGSKFENLLEFYRYFVKYGLWPSANKCKVEKKKEKNKEGNFEPRNPEVVSRDHFSALSNSATRTYKLFT